MSYRCRVQDRQNYRGRLQYDQNYRNDFRTGNSRGMKIIEATILEVDIEVAIEMKTLEEVRSRSKDRQYSSNFRRNDQCSNRSRLGLRASTNRGKIRYFQCRECDHFAKDCLNETEKEQVE